MRHDYLTHQSSFCVWIPIDEIKYYFSFGSCNICKIGINATTSKMFRNKNLYGLRLFGVFSINRFSTVFCHFECMIAGRSFGRKTVSVYSGIVKLGLM